ncbi:MULTISPECIES: hypothetical protein [unclassified Streptomyces]|uniref:hypothetical protein n=1 Tax=unclassified Streptomyces TaxID=2593676 RepID=UPI002E2FE2CF|nr:MULTISPECIES: hypothetical protein [unclassified Streptomyces]
MHNFGLGQRGHVLLIAGDVATRRRSVQVAPSANLAALGMVEAPVLLNSDVPCDTTYLDGARDPNTVLTRLRTAAATPGPLMVYLSGRLTVDRRGGRLHLALAGTTAGSVRYTALPWGWLGTELRGRPAGLTTVLLDVAADKAAWPLLQEYGSLPATPAVEVYGVVAPPGWSGSGNVVSCYTRAWIDQLRASPTRPSNLQLHALAAGAAALPPGCIVLPSALELGTTGPAPFPGAPFGRSGPDEGRPLHTVVTPASTPGQGGAGAWQAMPQGQHALVRGPHPSELLPVEAAVRLPADGLPVDAQPHLSDRALQHKALPAKDPRPHIHGLATSGRHLEAAALAQAWEQHVLQTCGTTSLEAIAWVEIRADLARMAGDFELATQLWTRAATTRMTRQAADAPAVHAAAAGALYCWTQLKDRNAALGTGPDLVLLLRSLPCLDARHLQLTQQRLQFLHREPSRH